MRKEQAIVMVFKGEPIQDSTMQALMKHVAMHADIDIKSVHGTIYDSVDLGKLAIKDTLADVDLEKEEETTLVDAVKVITSFLKDDDSDNFDDNLRKCVFRVKLEKGTEDEKKVYTALKRIAASNPKDFSIRERRYGMNNNLLGHLKEVFDTVGYL